MAKKKRKKIKAAAKVNEPIQLKKKPTIDKRLERELYNVSKNSEKE